MAKPYLLIDVGNSRVKWAMMEGPTLIAGGKWRHGGQLHAEALNAIPATPSAERIAVAFVASDAMRQVLQSWAREVYGVDIEWLVSPTEGGGVKNAYAIPASLGIDRWVCLLAAHAATPGYLCVVDAGSAVKIDLLAPDGQHLGGYILPGLSRFSACVIETTSLEEPSRVLSTGDRNPGRGTEDCLVNGALHAVCSSIEQSIVQLEQKVAQKVQCILTGGDSKVISEALSLAHAIEPALVLKGMAIMLKHGDDSP